jgi:hypothetical protein
MAKETFTVRDIQRAEFNLEPTICRNCGSTSASYQQYIGAVACPVCGFWDSGSQIKKQLKEQKITDMRKMMRVM